MPTTKKFLDQTGTGYLWSKIKQQLDTKADASDLTALASRVDTLEVSGYDDTALAARVTANETAIAGKAAQSDLTTLDGKVTTLIGSDTSKSVRTIANEELAAQLIAANADASLDTLEEIAAWIQSHPDDASAMNAAITALETKTELGTYDDNGTPTEYATVKAYVEGYVGAAVAAVHSHDNKSVIDGITITCIRKSPGWKHIILIVLVWLMWFFGIFCIWSFMQITTGALFSFILSIYYLFYAGLSYLYLCSIKHYDEHTHDTSKIVIFHGEKLYSLEYLGVFRPKRIRTMLIPIFPILYFVYNNVIIGIDNNVILNIGLFLSISSTSMILGGNVFGIESNFFDGIITRPLDTKRLLTQKYYFYSLLSFVCFILILPCHWFSHQYSIQVLVATLIYIIGTTNLFVLPTCLISSRWNLFETSYFNSQGNRLELNIFSIMSIIPMLIYITISMLLPQNIIMIIISILGLGGIVIHRRFIAWLANKWNSRRYELLERYRSF